MVLVSFKSFIPFEISPSMKKYLDDYNKNFISKKIQYYSQNKCNEKYLRLVNDATNLNHTRAHDINKQIQIYNNSLPPPENIKFGLILFSMSSLFMFLLYKKY